jgi:hypothetical protein
MNYVWGNVLVKISDIAKLLHLAGELLRIPSTQSSRAG